MSDNKNISVNELVQHIKRYMEICGGNSAAVRVYEPFCLCLRWT